jgi:hypothetical protein
MQVCNLNSHWTTASPFPHAVTCYVYLPGFFVLHQNNPLRASSDIAKEVKQQNNCFFAVLARKSVTSRFPKHCKPANKIARPVPPQNCTFPVLEPQCWGGGDFRLTVTGKATTLLANFTAEHQF